MISTLTPNPSFDRTLHVQSMAIGEVNRIDRVSIEAGGKGINVARAVASAGHAVRCIFAANPADESAFRSLLEPVDGIEFSIVPTTTPVRVNMTVVDGNGETTKLNEPGGAHPDGTADTLIAAAVEAAATSRWLVCSGSLPQGIADDFYAEVVARAGGQGAMIAIDTSGAALTHAARSGCDLLKPNREELEQIVGGSLETVGDVTDAASELVNNGISTLLVSLGGAGALLVSRDRVVHAATPATTVRNTVGAGDAFLSGFVADDRGGVDALRSAVTWGRAAVESETTGFTVPDASTSADVIITEDPDRSMPIGES